jgi:hypothetical protein
MRIDEKNSVRFVDMMYNFCNKYRIRFDYEWRCANHDICDICNVRFTAGSRCATYEIDFSDLHSLTEAAAPIMADVMNKFNINKAGCSVEIKEVIFNPPATIVFWADGTKTVVQAREGDEFDPEKGLAMAISKKALGNQGNYYNHFKKWTEKCKMTTIPFDAVTFEDLAAAVKKVFGIKD